MNILKRGFADLVIGEEPFMVGKIWGEDVRRHL
jgi:hypothetical protein